MIFIDNVHFYSTCGISGITVSAVVIAVLVEQTVYRYICIFIAHCLLFSIFLAPMLILGISMIVSTVSPALSATTLYFIHFQDTRTVSIHLY